MTEEFLTKRQAMATASLFRFCSLDPTRATADEFFCQPIWFVPFHDEPMPLIARTADQITVTPLSPGALQVVSGFPSQCLSPQEMARFLEAVDSSASPD